MVDPRENPLAYSNRPTSRHENPGNPGSKYTVLDLDPTSGMVGSYVDTLLPTLSSYTSYAGIAQLGVKSNDFSVTSQEHCSYNDIGLYVGKATNSDSDK
ncbi:hypothetical protein PR048_028777 [Dryococelus australis]|uniref:Uncharacterized protein n=1 Tax=Dryococelus australis TaxID=614101 RepID=A0ABQ9GBH3_9NEOP|nr:hypothetical protein PR048_028777 [Dryococelus australis]